MYCKTTDVMHNNSPNKSIWKLKSPTNTKHQAVLQLFPASIMHGPKIRIYIRISIRTTPSVIVCISQFGAHISKAWLEGYTSPS